ncbi:PREDICTED: uncharacterized protein LOC107345464 [Acropora digitifera]|uniref:uncharacterized protein LOC107345464 n=1 Tax=Acropora digitifera TaxID=70779 RepID=UPI00077B17DB|nr:PREDICTED: uncharacterized protein LOC107345464 [Acropora digitifera]
MSNFPGTVSFVPKLENSVPLEQSQNLQEVQVKEEPKEVLCGDVSRDTIPVVVKETPGNSEESGKVDPRQQWINTDETRPYYCKLCDFNMETMEFFQHHCMSPRHVKRAIEEFKIKLPRRLEDKEEKKPSHEFNCQVCLVTCNSDTAWNSHLLGQKHRKALEKQGAERAQQKEQEKAFMMNVMNTNYNQGTGRGGRGRGGGVGPMRGAGHTGGHTRKPYDKPMHAVQQPSASGPIGAKDFATYPEPLIGLEYVTEIQVIGQSPRYHCQLCDSKFDHNLKFPHLVGSKHRFNVLKEKVPEVAQHIRGDVKKRSELSSKLLEEAHKLEMMEGRQQVKTRVEKSPFNAINNQAATTRGGMKGSNSMQNISRGGALMQQTPFGRGQRGGRGGVVSTRGGMQAPTPTRGRAQGIVRGNAQGSVRGILRGRGNQQTSSYNSQQQFGFTKNSRGRGRGRGSAGGYNSNQAWNQNVSFSSVQNQPYAKSSFCGSEGTSQWDDNSFVGGEKMLPPEAFKNQQQFNQYDEFYDDLYGGEALSSTNYEYEESFSNAAPFRSPGTTSGVSLQSSQNQPFNAAPQGANANTNSSTGTGKKSVSLLQDAIADLGKLVSSEEDASVALQVSNALTHALLQFRMNSLPQEVRNNL